jgi:hypothetical protein
LAAVDGDAETLGQPLYRLLAASRSSTLAALRGASDQTRDQAADNRQRQPSIRPLGHAPSPRPHVPCRADRRTLWLQIRARLSERGTHARIRRAVKARGHFPNEQALKCVYMAIMSLDPTGTGQRRRSMLWKPALNVFDMAFDGRLSAGRR